MRDAAHPPKLKMVTMSQLRKTTAIHNALNQARALEWYELNLANLLRIFVAALFAGILLSRFSDRFFVIHNPQLVGVSVSIYVGMALLLWLISRNEGPQLRLRVLVGIALDLAFSFIALHELGGLNSGIGVQLLICVSMATLLLPARLALGVAAAAALVVLGELWLSTLQINGDATRNPFQAALFSAGFFLLVALVYWLSLLTKQSQAVAERESIAAASLSELNELIIQRMKMGVLVIDDFNQVRQANESAWYLLGMPSPTRRDLPVISPKLFDRLRFFVSTGKHQTEPLQLADGVPPVVPWFTRLSQENDSAAIIFLEDQTGVTRRAEELTLTSLGRLSAGIAHEVRNPLAAIRYSTQLLGESEQLNEPDRRLVEIVLHHCDRMNNVVENVLQLSRRERSRPEQINLDVWAAEFITEFKDSVDLGKDQLKLVIEHRSLRVLVDPSQLTQACWNLVRNALRYGRRPDEPAEVFVRIRKLNDQNQPVVEIIDRGPGIQESKRGNLFEPFYTTGEDGTGLGLYITKQLIEANQATIDFVPVPTGGSCFRIRLSIPQQSR
jgi:two-component system, NtrC family, sensor histidine kinase PilS